MEGTKPTWCQKEITMFQVRFHAWNQAKRGQKSKWCEKMYLKVIQNALQLPCSVFQYVLSLWLCFLFVFWLTDHHKLMQIRYNLVNKNMKEIVKIWRFWCSLCWNWPYSCCVYCYNGNAKEGMKEKMVHLFTIMLSSLGLCHSAQVSFHFWQPWSALRWQRACSQQLTWAVKSLEQASLIQI